MNSTSVMKAINGHRERNLSLRKDFEQKGVNLDEPRSIEFHFWAWTQRDAAVVAKALYKMGFFVTLIAPAPTDGDAERWSVETGAKIPLTQALGDDLTGKLVNLADAEDSVFDGWGTSI
jgi:regulator of RNase E activity RraB